MPDRRRSRGAATAIALVTAAAAFVIPVSIHPVAAAWTSAREVQGTVTAVTPATPTTMRCLDSGGAIVANIPVRWDAVSPTPTAYRVTYAAGSTTPPTSGTALPDVSGSSTSTTISSGLLSLGTYRVWVQSVYGTGANAWVSSYSAPATLQMVGVVVIVSYSCAPSGA
ncbi:MAG: hypothetical protein J0G30_03305 [Actinomycetales bacterium]|nr:hypothetical protein [Actinomycetales bacterium]